MSYSVSLVDDDGDTVEVPEHKAGGVVALGGSSRADMSVTYNYSYFYYNEICEEDGLRWCDGKRAGDTVDRLEEAVDVLGDEPHPDCDNHWCPSMGNAGSILATMIDWATQRPDATWRIV